MSANRELESSDLRVTYTSATLTGRRVLLPAVVLNRYFHWTNDPGDGGKHDYRVGQGGGGELVADEGASTIITLTT